MPEPRQRWRIAFARDARARGEAHRDAQAAWVAALAGAGLPLATSGARERPLVAIAASIPADADVDHDLAELFLGERLTVAAARARIAAALPPGYRLVALDDEWVGGPSLASRLAAADWSVTVEGPERHDRVAVEARVAALLASSTLSFRRGKEDAEGKEVDLRPAIRDLSVAAWDEAPARGILTMRLRHDQVAGAGRPLDVVEALALGLRPVALLRRRLWLADELEIDSPGRGP